MSEVLGHLGRDELAETARLVASELIANAVLHGVGPITVSVDARDGAVTLEVGDRGRGARLDGRPVMPGPDAPGGRGLPIVRALASDLDVDDGGGTTRVRAVLRENGVAEAGR